MRHPCQDCGTEVYFDVLSRGFVEAKTDVNGDHVYHRKERCDEAARIRPKAKPEAAEEPAPKKGKAK